MTDKEIQVWNKALEAAATSLEEFHIGNTGLTHPIVASDAARIRKLKK